MEDSEIIEMYFRRDEAAISETQNQYGRYLLKIARSVVVSEEDGQECVNDTYLKAWNSIPPHRPARLSAFLGKITRQLSIDVYRKKHSKKRAGSEYTQSLLELGDCVTGREDTEGSAELHELAAAINTYLRTLPDEVRDTFVLRYFFMDSIKDIAAYCGAGEAKIKSRLFRARAGLKIYLEQEGFHI